MGCSDSKPIHPPAVRSYVPDKPKTTQVVQSAKQLHQRDSSGSLKSFSDSALNVKLSNDKSLVLIWDGETPSRNAYHEQAVMVLKIKGIEYTEEVVSAASPPSWYKAIADPSLPFLIWKDNKTKEVSPAGRADIKGLFKFVEDHVKHPRLFIPSCMEDTRNLGRQGLNQLDAELHALLSFETPLAVTKQREAVVASLAAIDKSISERKYVGPFMFGTSISVVDVIYAPLFIRLEAAVRIRGLDIPTTLTHFIRYRDEMMATETVTSMVISLDLIIRHYERIAQRSAMSIPCFALQDKAISRHFKGVMTSAEAVVAGKDGASVKLAHKFNRLQTLVICKGVAMLRFVSKTLGEETVSAALQVMHDRSMEEFEKCRLLITALSKTGTGDQSNTTQDCLIALKSLNEGQATVRTEALEHFIQLYRNATPEIRWECQRLFFGGSTVLTGSFDPWLELTAYIIEGLTAEETELYLWQALLTTSLDRDSKNVAFKNFLGAISTAAGRGVINEAAWNVIQSRITRHSKSSVPLVLTASKSSASQHTRRQSTTHRSATRAQTVTIGNDGHEEY